MSVDAVNPASPPIPEPAVPRVSASPSAGAATAAPKDELIQQPADSTDVVVEIQKGNILVFKFIDQASGRVIEQIPSQGMLEVAQSVEAGEPDGKTGGGK